MYLDRTLQHYLDDLAARIPAPGGGSAAALCGATALSLMSMSARYTAGNAKYKSVEPRINELISAINGFRVKLQGLVDDDVTAYNKLAAGYKAFRDDKPQLQSMYKDAIKPPYEVCEIAGEAVILCKELAEIGNKNLITDTAIAAIMLECAFFSAKFNVYINLKCIEDMNFVEMIHKKLSLLEKDIPRIKEDILEICEDVISK